MIQGMTQRVDDLLRSLRPAEPLSVVPMESVDGKSVNIDQAVSVSSTSEYHDLEIVIKSMIDKVDETMKLWKEGKFDQTAEYDSSKSRTEVFAECEVALDNVLKLLS